MLIKKFCATAALILLLTGCQHAAEKAEPSAIVAPVSSEAQVSQLAAIVAGGIYLRERCQALEIPERAALFSQVTSLAQQRGWDTRHNAYQTLANQSEKLYLTLVNDTTPLSEQCAFFKSYVMPLMQRP